MISLSSPKAPSRGFTSHAGGCIVYCNGAQMRAHCRDDVTVVRVTGEIDATNIDRFYDYSHRFVGVASGLVLDLREVDFLCARGVSVLLALEGECRAARTQFAIVGNRVVQRLLHLTSSEHILRTANSEREALDIVATQQQPTLVAS